MVVAVLVVDEFHFAVNRKPVGVYVEQAHEYAHHQALVVEILVFYYFFYYHYLTVRRRNDNLFCIAVEIAFGATEEVDDYAINHSEHDYECPERNFAVDIEP